MASAGTVVDASGGVLVSIPVISKAKIKFTKQIIVKAKEECLAPKKYEKIKKLTPEGSIAYIMSINNTS